MPGSNFPIISKFPSFCTQSKKVSTVNGVNVEIASSAAQHAKEKSKVGSKNIFKSFKRLWKSFVNLLKNIGLRVSKEVSNIFAGKSKTNQAAEVAPLNKPAEGGGKKDNTSNTISDSSAKKFVENISGAQQGGVNDNAGKTAEISLGKPVKKEGRKDNASNIVSNHPSTENVSEDEKDDKNPAANLSQAKAQEKPAAEKRDDVQGEESGDVKSQAAKDVSLNEPAEKEGEKADTSNIVSNHPSAEKVSGDGMVDGSQISLPQAGSQNQPVEGKNADEMQNAVGDEATDDVKNQSAEVTSLNEPAEKKKGAGKANTGDTISKPDAEKVSEGEKDDKNQSDLSQAKEQKKSSVKNMSDIIKQVVLLMYDQSQQIESLETEIL